MLYKLYIILLFYFYIYRQIFPLMVKYGYIMKGGFENGQFFRNFV